MNTTHAKNAEIVSKRNRKENNDKSDRQNEAEITNDWRGKLKKESI